VICLVLIGVGFWWYRTFMYRELAPEGYLPVQGRYAVQLETNPPPNDRAPFS
jgi:hypothetical protein